jgi:hypothetical protein
MRARAARSPTSVPTRVGRLQSRISETARETSIPGTNDSSRSATGKERGQRRYRRWPRSFPVGSAVGAPEALARHVLPAGGKFSPGSRQECLAGSSVAIPARKTGKASVGLQSTLGLCFALQPGDGCRETARAIACARRLEELCNTQRRLDYSSILNRTEQLAKPSAVDLACRHGHDTMSLACTLGQITIVPHACAKDIT